MRRLAIIGASGHGKVIADIAKRIGYCEIVFFDDDESIHECGGYPVVGKSSEAGTLDADVIVGIGNAAVRKRILEAIPDEKLVTLIHPNAVIGENVHMENIVMDRYAKVTRVKSVAAPADNPGYIKRKDVM